MYITPLGFSLSWDDEEEEGSMTLSFFQKFEED